MLAARYVDAYAWVVFGTTLGMMLANAPVVWLGERIVKRVPIKLVHGISAALFMLLGIAALIGWS
jgi:putative Ca2+/H+ antiporter (TMEM165/GDT1 family)